MNGIRGCHLLIFFVLFSTDGDFNYDGKINGDDYFLIDASFQVQGAAFSSGESVMNGAVAVPEPEALSCVLLGAGVGLRSRKRR